MINNYDLHFNTSPSAPLSPEEQWLVTLSSPLSAFNGNYINSIETGEKIENLRNGVAQMYGITDRPSFRKAFEYTSEIGQRKKFELIWQTILKVESIRTQAPFWMKTIDAFVPIFLPMQISSQVDVKELAKQTEYSELDLKKRIPNLATGNTWVADLNRAFKKSFSMTIDSVTSLVAWDAVRLVSLSRWAVDLGLIDRVEFVRFAGALTDEVRNSYTSWQEVSAAYLAGGLIWQYSESRMRNLLRTNRMLLKEKNSPYMTVQF